MTNYDFLHNYNIEKEVPNVTLTPSVAGFGIGLAGISTICFITHHFEKRRSLAFGFVLSGVGLGGFALSPLLRTLQDQLGWRSSLLVVSSATAQFLVLGMFVSLPKRDVAKRTPSSSTSPRNVITLLQLRIFANKPFCLLSLSSVIQFFGISIIYVHLESFAKVNGVGAESVWLVSAIGLSNCVGRLVFGLLADSFNPIVLYFAGGIVCVIPAFFLPSYPSFVTAMITAVSFGFGTGNLMLFPILCIQFLGASLISTAFGYLILFKGIGQLVGAPCAGGYSTSMMATDWFGK